MSSEFYYSHVDLLLGELFYEVTVVFHCHNNHDLSADSVIHSNELKASPSGFRESNTIKYVQNCTSLGQRGRGKTNVPE